MAHPLRVRMLSLLVSGPLSATEVAAELDVAPPTASYHLKRLSDAGLAEPHSEATGARGRPSRRYRLTAGIETRLNRNDGGEVAFGSMVEDLLARHRALVAHRFEADAEVWMTPEALDRVEALARQLYAVVSQEAKRSRTPGTRSASITISVFELDRQA